MIEVKVPSTDCPRRDAHATPKQGVDKGHPRWRVGLVSDTPPATSTRPRDGLDTEDAWKSVIDVADVQKTYRCGGAATPVLHGVDLRVRRGECVFLAGPSGSGKTTLLSILGCILRPDCGTVRLFGENVGHLDEEHRTLMRRDRIGFVFQRFHLIRGLSVLDNVRVPLMLKDGANRQAESRVRGLLREVDLEQHAKTDARRLSSGQCQRVALARALALDPDVILADEPTASLDADNGRRVMELMRGMVKEKGKTLVAVTHDSRIFGYADRVCQMENGRIVEEQ